MIFDIKKGYGSPSKVVKLTENDIKALWAIAEGYPTRGEEDKYILVENPDFKPNNGLDPFYCISMRRILGMDEERIDDV